MATNQPTLRRVVSIVLIWQTVCWLIVGGLLHGLVPGGWLTIVGVAFLLVVPLLVLIRYITRGGYPPAPIRLWVYRPFWYGQLLLMMMAISGLLGAIIGLPFGQSVPAGRWAMASLGIILLVLGITGYIGTRRLVVRPLLLRFAHLPVALDGLRIVQVSDLHVGPHTSRRHLRRIMAAIQEAQPNLIAITGDQVDDYARDVEPFGEAFRELAAPLGVFAIAGNHDVYAGWAPVRKGLEAMGLTVLVNDAVPLVHRGVRFWVAGTGDPAGNHWHREGGDTAAPDLDRTMRGIPPDDFKIVLAHNPLLWPPLVRRGADLTLSGHTHHGQFSIPMFGWSLASIFLEHAMGLHRDGNALLYINPGTNYWGIPFRIGALPEVTVLTLRRGDA